MRYVRRRTALLLEELNHPIKPCISTYKETHASFRAKTKEIYLMFQRKCKDTVPCSLLVSVYQLYLLRKQQYRVLIKHKRSAAQTT